MFTSGSILAKQVGLLAWWPFDDGSGWDISGANRFLTPNNGPTPVGGVSLARPGGQRLAINLVRTSTQYLRGSAISPQPTTIFTIAFWAKTPTPNMGGAYICTNRDVGGGNDKLAVIFGFNTNKYEVFSSSVSIRTAITGSITDSLWHHLAVTYDGSNVRWYIDGAPDSTTAKSVTLTTGATDFIIGTDLSGSNWNGAIDDMRWYSRQLSSGEIKALYNEPFLPIGNEVFRPGIDALGWIPLPPPSTSPPSCGIIGLADCVY